MSQTYHKEEFFALFSAKSTVLSRMDIYNCIYNSAEEKDNFWELKYISIIGF